MAEITMNKTTVEDLTQLFNAVQAINVALVKLCEHDARRAEQHATTNALIYATSYGLDNPMFDTARNVEVATTRNGIIEIRVIREERGHEATSLSKSLTLPEAMDLGIALICEARSSEREKLRQIDEYRCREEPAKQ